MLILEIVSKHINIISFLIIFQTEKDYDYLTIYDGSNDQSSQIAKLSGNIRSYSLSSTDNLLFVKFEADDEDNIYGGFFLTFHYGKLNHEFNS